MCLSQAVIVILIIILFNSFYQQYLFDQCGMIWEFDKSFELFIKLKKKFGEPEQIIFGDTTGVLWNLSELPFKKIILINSDNNLIVTLFIKLFEKYNNIQITKKAVYYKLSQITQLSKNINYDTFTQTATIKSNSWENILSLSILLTKLSTSELNLSEIKKGNLIQYYTNKALENEEFCYLEIDQYFNKN